MPEGVGGFIMIIPKQNESRLQYLARVLYHFMNESLAGSETIDYDDTTCDGLCLAQDFLAALNLDEFDINS